LTCKNVEGVDYTASISSSLLESFERADRLAQRDTLREFLAAHVFTPAVERSGGTDAELDQYEILKFEEQAAQHGKLMYWSPWSFPVVMHGRARKVTA
jgi:hypothetical protein